VLLAAASKERSPWIVKPAASSRGRGIFLIMSVRNSGFAFSPFRALVIIACIIGCHLADFGAEQSEQLSKWLSIKTSTVLAVAHLLPGLDPGSDQIILIRTINVHVLR